MPTFEFEIYGPAGSGKTVTLACLYNHFYALNREPNATGRILEQSARLNRGEFPRPTPALTGPGADVEAAEHRERLSCTQPANGGEPVRWTITSHGGEELLPAADRGGESTWRYIDFLAASDTRFLVATVNPFVCNLDLARRALRGLTAVLQGNLNLALYPAVTRAAWLLFNNVLVRGRPDGTVESELYNGLQRDFKEVPESARVIYNPHAATERDLLRVEPEASQARVFTVLDRVAETVTDNMRPPLSALRAGVKRFTDDCVVVLTHVDLLDLIPTLRTNHLEPVFDDLFGGAGDRRTSQHVLGAHLWLSISTDPAAPVRLLRPRDDIALKLSRSLALQVARRQAASRQTRTPPPATQTVVTEGEGSDNLAGEVVYRTLALSPLLLLWAVCRVPFLHSPRVLWLEAGFGLLALAVVAFLWARVRRQWPLLAWRVVTSSDGNHRVQFRGLFGSSPEAPAGQARLSTSLLGSLCGVGRATLAMNRLTSYTVPNWLGLRAALPGPVARVWWPELRPLATLLGLALLGLFALAGPAVTLQADPTQQQVFAGSRTQIKARVQREHGYDGPVLILPGDDARVKAEPVLIPAGQTEGTLSVQVDPAAAGVVALDLKATALESSRPQPPPVPVSLSVLPTRVPETRFALAPPVVTVVRGRTASVEAHLKLGSPLPRLLTVKLTGPSPGLVLADSLPVATLADSLTVPLPLSKESRPGDHTVEVEAWADQNGKTVSVVKTRLAVRVLDPVTLSWPDPPPAVTKGQPVNVRFRLELAKGVPLADIRRLTYTLGDNPLVTPVPPPGTVPGLVTVAIPPTHPALAQPGMRDLVVSAEVVVDGVEVHVASPTLTIKVP